MFSHRLLKLVKFGPRKRIGRPSTRPVVEELENRLVPTQVSIPTGLTGPAGGTVTVPINVDTLADPPSNPVNQGLFAADLVVFYDPSVFTVSPADVNLGTISSPSSADPSGTGNGDGYSPSSPNGWIVTVATPPTSPGLLDIRLGNDGSGIISGTGGGQLVNIIFHISASVPAGTMTPIDLAADTGDGDPANGIAPTDATQLVDEFINNYTLNPAPLDNATLTPNSSGAPFFNYTGSDPDDGSVTVSQAVPHFVINAPTNVAANTQFPFTVVAANADGSTNTSYTGQVTFSSTDGAATLPGTSSLLNGVGVFTATLATPGNQIIFASDGTNNLQGSSNSIVVTGPHFQIVAPTTVTAGSAFAFTVIAVTANDVVNPNYSGIVQFTSTDPLANSPPNLPADANLNSGIGYFAAVLETAGKQEIIVTDSADGSQFGIADVIVVGAGEHFDLSLPTNVTAGTSFSYTVTAVNANGATDTSYAGTVNFSSSDSQAAIPAPATLSGGTGVFTATLKTAGSQTLTAVDLANSTIAGASGTIIVSPAALAQFTIKTPNATTAGNPFVFTLTATDAFGNLASGYSGTVHFAVTDSAGTIPVNSTISGGVGYFAAVLRTAGTQTITAVDTVTNTLSGISAPILVEPGAAAQFLVTSKPNIPAGTPFKFTVTALDQFNNTVTNYNGTVGFSSGDSLSSLPASTTLTSGTGTFSATLSTAGSQLLRATGLLSGQSFIQGSTIGVGGLTPDAMVEADFNGDGKLDLAVANTGSGSVSIIPGVGNGTFAVGATYAVGNSLFALATGDFNGDGSMDLVVVSTDANGDYVSILLGNGDGTFKPAVRYDVDGAGFTANGVAVGNFGNGKLDLAVTSSSNTAGSFVSILMGTGTGTFGSATDFRVGAAGSTDYGVAVGSFRNNGILDIAASLSMGPTGTASQGDVAVLLGNGNGTFQTAVNYQVGSDPRGIAVGYFAHNGIADIAVASSGSNSVAVLAGQGNGTFTSSGAAVGDTPVGIALADFNGDNNLDVMTADSGINSANSGTQLVGQESAAEGLGNNHLGTVLTVPVGPLNSQPQAIVAGDFTGGGLIDLAVANSVPNTLTVMLNQGITGKVNVNVSSTAATHFVVTGPTNATPGTSFTVTVTAEDVFNNTFTGYSGTVHFTSTDGAAVLPANGTLTSGVGTFSVTLNTLGSQTISATDTSTSSLTGSSAAITVTSTSLSHFAVSAPIATTAGNAFVFIVTAEDAANHTFTAYNGTVTFASSDSKAFLPTSGTLINGVGFFAAILKTAGTQTISVADSAVSSESGVSNNVVVSPGAAARFVVTPVVPTFAGMAGAYPNQPGVATSFAVTGLPLTFTVAAQDAYGNMTTNYSGTVAFTSSDSAAVLPASHTLLAGVGIFSATLNTAGTQSLTATDTVANSGPNAITGNSGSVLTRGLAVTSFAQTPTGYIITFDKAFNPGTVNLYTTGTLPDTAILTTTNSQVSVRGSLLFNANDTSMTFVKTNNVSAAGTINPTNGLLAAGKYTATLRSFAGSNGFEDALGNALDGTVSGGAANFLVTFTVAALPVAVGIPDFARAPSNTDAVFLPSTLTNGSTFALSYTNPSANPPTGGATITFSTVAATLQLNIQTALTTGGLATQIGTNPAASNTPNSAVIVTNDTTTGANVLITFQSALAQATSQLLTSNTPGVNISFANINVANNLPGSGIPIALSSGLNVTSGGFTLQYNPSFLNITGVTASAALAAVGASFSVVSNNTVTGTLTLTLSSPTRISSTSTAITLGTLQATVPLSATASYGAKQLLHFSGETLNGTAGPIIVTNQDAVQVLAYFGNVTDTGGPLTLGDAIAISTVASTIPNTTTQTLPGFGAFPNLDPAIIGNVSLTGSVSSTDGGAMLQQLGGSARPTIPYAPIGLPVTPVGPDPTLAVDGGTLSVVGGQTTVLVPVDIDTARPEGSSGMMDATLALSYDPKVFDVSASDVRLGTVPDAGSGWELKTEVNPLTGLIGVEVFSPTPIQTTAGGSLITVAMHLREAVPPGTQLPTLTLVPYVDPSGGLRVYQTQVTDGRGAFVLDVLNGGRGVVDGGQGMVNGGQGVVNSGRLMVDGGQGVGVVTEVSTTAPAESALALAALEQFFANLAQAELMSPEGVLGQPSPILNSVGADAMVSHSRNAAAGLAAAVGLEPDWMTASLVAAPGQQAWDELAWGEDG
jgi:hypothetical protein